MKEGKDMADQNEAKTKTIGFLPIEKVQTLNGWDEYADKSTKLSVLRTEAQKAKNSVRDALKERLNEKAPSILLLRATGSEFSGSFGSSSKGGGLSR
jgi:hypothetical protein